MSFYMVSSGYDSDYEIHAFLEGPPDADLPALQHEWIESLSEHDLVRVRDYASALTLWLCGQPEWRDVDYREHNMGEDGLDGWKTRKDVLVAAFGPQPKDLVSVTGDERQHFRHTWERWVDDTGQRVWLCRLCHSTVPANLSADDERAVSYAPYRGPGG